MLGSQRAGVRSFSDKKTDKKLEEETRQILKDILKEDIRKRSTQVIDPHV